MEHSKIGDIESEVNESGDSEMADVRCSSSNQEIGIEKFEKLTPFQR